MGRLEQLGLRQREEEFSDGAKHAGHELYKDIYALTSEGGHPEPEEAERTLRNMGLSETDLRSALKAAENAALYFYQEGEELLPGMPVKDWQLRALARAETLMVLGTANLNLIVADLPQENEGEIEWTHRLGRLGLGPEKFTLSDRADTPTGP